MKKLSIEQIAKLVDGIVSGVSDQVINNADTIRDARSGYVTFAENVEYLGKALESQASAILIPDSIDHSSEAFQALDLASKPLITVVGSAAKAFGLIVKYFRPELEYSEKQFSKSDTQRPAGCDPSAQIGTDVKIHANVHVGPGVKIGDRCRIHAGVNIMSGTIIGDDTEIYPNAVIYENTVIGSNCLIHANAVIGCFGFGYDSSSGTEHKLGAQYGNVIIEDDCEVGAGTTIDRAAYGSTKIGSGTKIDNQVQIGHNCLIGKRNLICALVGIAGSCTTGDDVVMAGQVGIGDHLNIGNKVILGAKAGVMADIPDEKVFVGIPATPAKQQMLIVAAKHKLPEMRKKVVRMEKELAALKATVESSNSETESGSEPKKNSAQIDDRAA